MFANTPFILKVLIINTVYIPDRKSTITMPSKVLPYNDIHLSMEHQCNHMPIARIFHFIPKHKCIQLISSSKE